MAYVTLDKDDNITGIFNMPQAHLPGFKVISDDDVRITVFNSAQKPEVMPTLSDLQAQLTEIQNKINMMEK